MESEYVYCIVASISVVKHRAKSVVFDFKMADSSFFKPTQMCFRREELSIFEKQHCNCQKGCKKKFFAL